MWELGVWCNGSTQALKLVDNGSIPFIPINVNMKCFNTKFTKLVL